MFIVDFFTGNKSKPVKKGKKKKKIDDRRIEFNHLNPLKEVKMCPHLLTGDGPKKTECQDSYCTIDRFADDCFFMAVYDGHGASGKDASHSANEYIQNYLEKNTKKIKTLNTDKKKEDFLKSAFKTTEDKLKASGIDYSNSGTCCISAFIQRNKCYVANLGDSRAVLCRVSPKETSAIELSNDHKPTRDDERVRIMRAGGKIRRFLQENVPVGPLRVWIDEEGPGIAMTRTLGDWLAKKIGLVSDPEIECIELLTYDRFLVIGSDGLWDVMGSKEVVGFVLQHEDRETAVKDLVEEAKSRWEERKKSKKKENVLAIGDVPSAKPGRDDITAVIAYFTFYKDEELEEIAKYLASSALDKEKEKEREKDKKDKKDKKDRRY